MGPRVHNCSYLMANEIDMDQRTDALALDSLVNRCIAAASEALRTPTAVFTDVQQQHVAQVYKSMRPTHETIRDLLRAEKSPRSVDAVPIARLQLETLYALCLILEQPPYLDVYLKDSWKQIYVRHLLMATECKNLPTITAELDKQVPALEGLRKLAGVTDEEKATIRSEQLNEPLPSGVQSAPIPQFPTPGIALRHIRDADRKRMLCRLYSSTSPCAHLYISQHTRELLKEFSTTASRSRSCSPRTSWRICSTKR